MSYERVIPRDLFNEAKLLKCLGQIALILLDHEGQYPITLEHDDAAAGFIVEQNPSSGELYCSTLHLYHTSDEDRDREIYLSTRYNCKDAYPLLFVIDEEWDGRVFDDHGNFSADFLAALEGMH